MKSKLTDQRIKDLVNHVKDKAELRNLDETYVAEYIEEHLQKHKDAKDALLQKESYSKLQKKKAVKEFIKAIRSALNITYGMFKTNKSKKIPKLLDQLKETLEDENVFSSKSMEIHKKLLDTHTSTHERLAFYKEIYKELFSKTGKPTSILDLGCGLNPLSYVYMDIDKNDKNNNNNNNNNNKIKYTAIELSSEDCNELNIYFKVMDKHSNLRGKAQALNLLQLKKQLPQTDVCFMFKTLDVLEGTQMKIRERIFPLITSTWIVVSFSTETINKKPILADRSWFPQFLTQQGYQYETKEWKNELFYIIENIK